MRNYKPIVGGLNVSVEDNGTSWVIHAKSGDASSYTGDFACTPIAPKPNEGTDVRKIRIAAGRVYQIGTVAEEVLEFGSVDDIHAVWLSIEYDEDADEFYFEYFLRELNDNPYSGEMVEYVMIAMLYPSGRCVQTQQGSIYLFWRFL